MNEHEILLLIADRVVAEFDNYPDNRKTLIMDLYFANQDCPMDFERLLNFPPFDFAHDIYGIRQHINRQTLKLEGCFLPRCARSNG